MNSPCVTNARHQEGPHNFFNGNFLEMDQPSSKHNFEDPYDTIEDFDYEEMKDGINRIATFENWPKNSPVNALDLAAAGFFYLGKDDSVKCFSCEVHLKQWVAGDDPFVEHKKHKPKCAFVQTFDKSPLETTRPGTSSLSPTSPATDQPGPLNIRSGQVIDQLHHNIAYPPSYQMNLQQQHQPSEHLSGGRYMEQPMNFHPSQLAHPHFQMHHPASLPTQQPVQATSHSPEHLHLPFPAGPYIPGQQYNPGRSNSLPGHIAVSPTNERGSSPLEPLSASWSHPVATDYSDYNTRILSYKHWPAKAILRPTELAQAGFYYTSHDDGVTCHKCKVSLKGWEPNDTPWGEHKKWSPNCPLVLEHFTESAPIPGGSRRQPPMGHSLPVAESQIYPPNMPRPPRTSPGYQLMSPEDFHLGNVPAQPLPRMPTTSGPPSVPPPQPSSVPGLSLQGLDTGNLAASDLERVSDMGFSEKEIREVFKTQAANGGVPFTNIDELVQALLYHQGFQSQRRRSGGSSRSQEPMRSSASENKQSNASTTDPSNDNMKRELERMQEARLCKICMDEDVGIVFLPCGHLVCCPECAHGLKICPMCRGDITDTIRTYFS